MCRRKCAEMSSQIYFGSKELGNSIFSRDMTSSSHFKEHQGNSFKHSIFPLNFIIIAIMLLRLAKGGTLFPPLLVPKLRGQKDSKGPWVEKKRFTVDHSAMNEYPGSSGSLVSYWSPGERLDIFHR